MPILDHLEPQAVFSYFEQLCAIPHGSGNTKEISDHLVLFAAEHHLRCIQDAHNNVIIFAPGTPGYESAAPVILQGHMDMVCETAPDCTKDMAREGLDLFVDGDTIGARGTTLGGDDGIAVAMALAILAAGDIPHPPLEVVITVDEETGMLGAAALDASVLKGIEKAILASDLGLNPQNDGRTIRLIFPALTEERRRDLVKQVKKYGEEAKVAVRNIRRDAMDKFKAQKKKSEITEDDLKIIEKDLQKLTDDYIKEVERIADEKEKELMEI